jgi:DNA-directed RNA polymerase II subunit RPB1
MIDDHILNWLKIQSVLLGNIEGSSGDEMNIYLPQEPKTQAEIKHLVNLKNNMISGQSNSPVIKIIMDSLVGTYKLTTRKTPLSRADFFHVSMGIQCYENADGTHENNFDIIDKLEYIQSVRTKYGYNTDDKYTGHNLFSCILPSTFNYTNKNDADTDHPILIIKEGVVLEGGVNKKQLGGGNRSFVNLFYKEYSPETAVTFVDQLTNLADAYLELVGFSVGLQDCIIDTEGKQKVNEFISKSYIEARGELNITQPTNILEGKLNMILSKAKDVGQKMAANVLSKDNNLKIMVESGSKGNMVNIAQITGLLGQQCVTGDRIKKNLAHNTRTLPHYPANVELLANSFFKISDKQLDTIFESRGFISNSYIDGLNPRQFHFHAASARESLMDTSVKTAESGYLQRRMVKAMEDFKVHHDGSVRDTNDKIVQLQYGGDGLDPTVIVKGVRHMNDPQIIDITRLAEKLENDILIK